MRQARIRWPEKPAVIVGARTLTYQELDRAANRFANAVLALLGPSTSKVAFLLNNCLEYPVALYGAARLGSLSVHMSPRFTSRELLHVLTQTAAEVLIVDAKTLPVAEEVGEELPKPPQLIGVVTEGRHPLVVFDEFIEGQPESEIDHPMRPEDPFCIQYTSGTTGKPKGVIASHLARITSATAAMEDFPIQHTDVLAVTTPLCHAAGLFTWFQPAMLAGATAVLMPGWHPEEFIQAVDRHQVTGAFVVPVQLRMLLDDPPFRRAS